ncbi:hypothetical protein [Luteolibacter sp. AS25]|uniref:hypothetical protein n=1 Tax=Luteolibacter sp. AS25 TaxID=3135776 RepID=UPI00398B9576
MKVKSIAILAIALGAVGAAQAGQIQSEKGAAQEVVAKEEGKPGKADKKKKMLEKYDEDGDGKLSDEEKAKMKKDKGEKKPKKDKKKDSE